MPQPRSLDALFSPKSVALVGATDRPGSLGRIVYENLLAGEFRGELHAVNRRGRRIFGRPSLRTLRALKSPLDLALIAVPHDAVTQVLADASRAGARAAVLLGAPPESALETRRFRRNLVAVGERHRIAILGDRAFGILRPGIGLNASIAPVDAMPGRLALVAQSGAICAAMLDFARHSGIGFSTVVAPGAAIDVDFGDLLDALVLDPLTDAIVVHVERIRDARRFVSALRAAARTKPVAVLKAGRTGSRSAGATGSAGPSPDAVFEAALRRTGVVGVRTYTELFAAARALANVRIPRDDRLAIVTNGRGSATLAADAALDLGVALAAPAAPIAKSLAALLPRGAPIGNPFNVGGDAPPERFAAAASLLVHADDVDAVIAIHVPRPASSAIDAARAVAAVAREADKPVLGAWLGTVHAREAQDALEAGRIVNFFTPENAVLAFSWLAAYRRHQRWLLEVPPPLPEPVRPDLDAAERIRRDLAAENRSGLTAIEIEHLLASFGLPVPKIEAVESLAEALAAARRLGYPVRIAIDGAGGALPPSSPVASVLRNSRMVTRAWGELRADSRDGRRRREGGTIVIVAERPLADAREFAIGVHVDPTFGTVITFGAGGAASRFGAPRTVLLPPLNRRLIVELLDPRQSSARAQPDRDADPAFAPLIPILSQVSAMACALPWLTQLSLDPVRVAGDRAVVASASAFAEPRRRVAAGYRHMAIHPYPIELAADVVLRDGMRLHIRPIRPEDAEMERDFVAGLSEQSRYYRFFHRLTELTPAMLARFTQIDYDRELALIALRVDGPGPEIIGVARTVASTDRRGAEFAIVVADAWQRRGIARSLMLRLIAASRARGLARLEGIVLRENAAMLAFTESLGFVTTPSADDRDVVNIALELARRSRVY